MGKIIELGLTPYDQLNERNKADICYSIGAYIGEYCKDNRTAYQTYYDTLNDCDRGKIDRFIAKMLAEQNEQED